MVAVIGAVGGLWAIVRKDKGSAITHLNRVIKGHERYAKTLEDRVEDYQKKYAAVETDCRDLKSELTAMTLDRDRLAKDNERLADQNADLQVLLKKANGG